LKFSNGNTCYTSTFDIDASGDLNSSCGGITMGSGEYCLSASGIHVPELGSTACGSQGTCINQHLYLGSYGNGDASLWIHGETDPVIQ
jgi:hypothetical protein